MDIAPEEWLFARHALQWICFHQDIYEDRHALSTQILLNATELSVCSETHQEEVLEYDTERLRYTLGSLVTVDDRNLVFLAHYTVREYLESPRISDSMVRCFQIGQKTTTSMLMRIILQEAQRIEWTEGIDKLIEHSVVDYTPDTFFQDFAVFCVISSMMIILTTPNTIASDKELLSLVSDFMNPALDHYLDASYVCRFFEDVVDFFSDLNFKATRPMEFLMISTDSNSVDHVILLHLLLMAPDTKTPVLAEAFLRGRDATVLVQGHVQFSMHVPMQEDSYIDDKAYGFDGSLFEVMAQLSGYLDGGFAWLLERCNTAMDISVLLPTINYHHIHSHSTSDARDRCELQKILDRGADPNATQYSTTPLQIAAATRDVEGVRELLRAGANANATGNPSGVRLKADSILSWCNELYNLSPLYICRDFKSSASPPHHPDDAEEMEKRIELGSPLVEALLLQYGAEEYLPSP
jgi:hypothetical protein